MIARMCALALLAAAAGLVLREFGWRGAPLLSVICGIAATGFVLPYFAEAKAFYSGLSSDFGIGNIAASALKIVGIGYLSGITADVCRNLGETGAASAVVLVGKMEIIAIAAPYFFDIVEMGVSLLCVMQ